jgi:hypothetical protein
VEVGGVFCPVSLFDLVQRFSDNAVPRYGSQLPLITFFLYNSVATEEKLNYTELISFVFTQVCYARF